MVPEGSCRCSPVAGGESVAVAAVVKAGMGVEIASLAGMAVAQGGVWEKLETHSERSQSSERQTQGNMWKKPVRWKVRARSHLKNNLTMAPLGA